MPEVTMPRLSDTMQEGTISQWLKKPGDQVNKGDILAEIETDKASMDLESYDTGVLEQILVQAGETAPIGQAIAIIGTGAGAQSQPPAQPSASADRTHPATQTATPSVESKPQLTVSNVQPTDVQHR